jgi:hypothetical protein
MEVSISVLDREHFEGFSVPVHFPIVNSEIGALAREEKPYSQPEFRNPTSFQFCVRRSHIVYFTINVPSHFPSIRYFAGQLHKRCKVVGMYRDGSLHPWVPLTSFPLMRITVFLGNFLQQSDARFAPASYSSRSSSFLRLISARFRLAFPPFFSCSRTISSVREVYLAIMSTNYSYSSLISLTNYLYSHPAIPILIHPEIFIPPGPQPPPLPAPAHTI